MPCTRRDALRIAAGGAAALTIGGRSTAAGSLRRPAAIAFDAFPIFDPRPIAELAKSFFPEKGAELMNAWRTRQFEYTWLRTISGRYRDFRKVTEDALTFAARMVKVDLTAERRERLVGSFSKLETWPDVLPALRELKAAGLRLAFLSNFTPEMLIGCIETAGLGGMFEHVLSTDRARTYKPDPAAYRLGTEAFGIPREQILFVPFAGWDTAGAKAFGYPAFWINRLGLPPEELGLLPDGAGASLFDLVAFVQR